jgi:hypothetical protein
VADVEDERHADQLDPALEALEVGISRERREVDVAAAADERQVEEQVVPVIDSAARSTVVSRYL